MEENKVDDNAKEVNDTDDFKTADFQKTIMMNRNRLRQSGESQSDSLLLRTMTIWRKITMTILRKK